MDAAILLLLLALAIGVYLATRMPRKSLCWVKQGSIPGPSLSATPAASAKDCCQQCASQAGCRAAVLSKGVCYTKRSSAALVQSGLEQALFPRTSCLRSDGHGGAEVEWPANSTLVVHDWTPQHQQSMQGVSARQLPAQFKEQAFLLGFRPGTYSDVAVSLGYNMQACGFGLTPSDTLIHGAIYALGVDGGDSSCGGNADNVFRRTLSNMTIAVPTSKGPGVPRPGTLSWATSQQCPLRSVNIQGNLTVGTCCPSSNLGCQAWASGVAAGQNCVISGTFTIHPQNQFLVRNADVASIDGSGPRFCLIGNRIADGRKNDVAATPAIREIPFLCVDLGWWLVVPGLERDKVGASCSTPPGTRFCSTSDVAFLKPGQDAQLPLAAGKHLVFLPGTHALTAPLVLSHKDTVVLGLGQPMLRNPEGKPALQVQAPGATVSGIVFVAAGDTPNLTLIEVGSSRHTAGGDNFTVLHDLQLCIGGWNGRNETVRIGTAITVHMSNVVLDNVHLWVADHGNFGGWDTGSTGCGHECQYRLAAADICLKVYGNHVYCYGLCVEHFHAGPYVDWYGTDGKVYGFMAELSYFLPGNAVQKHPVVEVHTEAKRFELVTNAIYSFKFGKKLPQADPCMQLNASGARVSKPTGVDKQACITACSSPCE